MGDEALRAVELRGERSELHAVELHDKRSELHASFLPDAGMLCCSLRHRGEELLARNAGVEAYVQRGKTLGIPLLYPWANRLADFAYTAAGRSVQIPRAGGPVAQDPNGLPIHGVIGGRMRWELLDCEREGGGEASPGMRGGEAAPDTCGEAESPGMRGGGAELPGMRGEEVPGMRGEEVPGMRGGDPAGTGSAVAARLRWRESEQERFAVFPFPHDVLYEARLWAGALQISVTVEACCEERVPVAFGFHPYLSPPGVPRERWRVSLPAMRPLVLDAQQIPVGTGEPLPTCTFELGEREFDDGFDRLAPGARFQLEADARELVVELVEGYACAQLYAPRARPTICFEPMTAPADALRSGTGLRVLAAGESYRATFALRVASALRPS